MPGCEFEAGWGYAEDLRTSLSSDTTCGQASNLVAPNSIAVAGQIAGVGCQGSALMAVISKGDGPLPAAVRPLLIMPGTAELTDLMTSKTRNDRLKVRLLCFESRMKGIVEFFISRVSRSQLEVFDRARTRSFTDRGPFGLACDRLKPAR